MTVAYTTTSNFFNMLRLHYIINKVFEFTVFR